MHKRIQDTKQYMIQLTDNQLELTTKRTIMENEQMTAEVAYQSHQTSAVIAQNKDLDGRIAELRRALNLSRETENELAKRNMVYQSTIKQLVCPMPSSTCCSRQCCTHDSVQNLCKTCLAMRSYWLTNPLMRLLLPVCFQQFHGFPAQRLAKSLRLLLLACTLCNLNCSVNNTACLSPYDVDALPTACFLELNLYGHGHLLDHLL